MQGNKSVWITLPGRGRPQTGRATSQKGGRRGGEQGKGCPWWRKWVGMLVAEGTNIGENKGSGRVKGK